MKLVFVHSGPLSLDKEGKYHGYGYRSLNERYSRLADSISFLIRVRRVEQGMALDTISEGIHVMEYPDINSPALFIKNILPVKKVIADSIADADILILRQSAASSIAQKYAIEHGIPYIYECVGCAWDSLWNHSLLGKIVAPYSFLSLRRNIRRAGYVHYVTNEFLQRRYPTSGVALACSDVVIEDVPLDVLHDRCARAEQSKGSRRIVLGTAGAIDVRYKGQQYVIRAIPRLLSEGYDVEYRLAGPNRKESTYLADMARRLGVSERVIILGGLSSNEMPAFYDSIDIYVQPSKTEGMPRAVIEAMSRGCPVIGSNVGGIPELIDHKCLFRPGSTRSIIRAIERIVADDCGHISMCNYQRAKEFLPEALDAKRERFYDQFLEENALKDNYLEN